MRVSSHDFIANPTNIGKFQESFPDTDNTFVLNRPNTNDIKGI